MLLSPLEVLTEILKLLRMAKVLATNAYMVRYFYQSCGTIGQTTQLELSRLGQQHSEDRHQVGGPARA
jgi:hypothetical protein